METRLANKVRRGHYIKLRNEVYFVIRREKRISWYLFRLRRLKDKAPVSHYFSLYREIDVLDKEEINLLKLIS